MIITKEKDDKNIGRRAEFPKLILEEENIGMNEVEKTKEKTLSSREIITFLLFCTFFIINVYFQIDIESSYAMNSAVRTALQTNKQQFDEIYIERNYWAWF